MSFYEIIHLPTIYILLCGLGVAIFEWFIPYPYFIRPRLLLSPFAYLGSKVNKPTNDDQKNYFAGIMLPTIIIVPALILYVATSVLVGEEAEKYLALLTLLLILESRPYRTLGKIITKELKANNIQGAKELLQKFILRDTSKLSCLGLTKATIEFIVLRLFNSFYVPLFYFLLFGIETALSVKLLVLLSQALNSKLPSNAIFGMFTKKLVNIFYILPAISLVPILAITPYKASKASLSHSLEIYNNQWPNKVSGILLAYVAGMLNFKVGGPRHYSDIIYRFPQIGGFKEPEITDIKRATRLTSFAIIFTTLAVVLIKSAIYYYYILS